MKKTSFILIALIFSSLGMFISVANAQRDGEGTPSSCVWEFDLLANGATFDTTVRVPNFKTTEASKLKLKVSSPNINACKEYFGFQMQYKGAYVQTPPGGAAKPLFAPGPLQQVEGSEITYTQALGSPAANDTTYTYIVDQGAAGGINGSFAAIAGEQKRIVIQFDDSKPSSLATNNTNNNTGGNINGNANGGAGLNNNGGTPNSQINTGIGGSFELGLDEQIGNFFNPLEKDTLPELMAGILRILFALIGTIAVIIIIISGFRMVMASGNESELTKAKAAITWAIVGLIVSLMAFSIVAIIQRLIQG